MTAASKEGLVKILFRVVDSDGGVNVETLWAEPLGDDRYRVRNCPFYAYRTSFLDVVHAEFDESEGHITFRRVVEKSGHRTLRVIFKPPVSEKGAFDQANPSDRLLDSLAKLGCTYEGANRVYICIDVPPHVPLDAAVDVLVGAQAQWEYADPKYDDLHPQDASP